MAQDRGSRRVWPINDDGGDFGFRGCTDLDLYTRVLTELVGYAIKVPVIKKGRCYILAFPLLPCCNGMRPGPGECKIVLAQPQVPTAVAPLASFLYDLGGELEAPTLQRPMIAIRRSGRIGSNY